DGYHNGVTFPTHCAGMDKHLNSRVWSNVQVRIVFGNGREDFSMPSVRLNLVWVSTEDAETPRVCAGGQTASLPSTTDQPRPAVMSPARRGHVTIWTPEPADQSPEFQYARRKPRKQRLPISPRSQFCSVKRISNSGVAGERVPRLRSFLLQTYPCQ